jgi:hypothetical protein
VGPQDRSQGMLGARKAIRQYPLALRSHKVQGPPMPANARDDVVAVWRLSRGARGGRPQADASADAADDFWLSGPEPPAGRSPSGSSRFVSANHLLNFQSSYDARDRAVRFGRPVALSVRLRAGGGPSPGEPAVFCHASFGPRADRFRVWGLPCVHWSTC